MDDIERLRFSSDSHTAFQLIKRFSKYHMFEKRDGGIVNHASLEGRTITGEELEEKLMAHFNQVHNALPPPLDGDPVLPKLELPE